MQMMKGDLKYDPKSAKWYKIMSLFHDVLDPLLCGEHGEEYLKILRCISGGSVIYAGYLAIKITVEEHVVKS